MRRFAVVALAALVLLPVAGQARSPFGGTRGDGQKVTQPRQVGAFTAVRVEGSIDAAVKVGGAPSVAVTIDQNLQPLVITEVSGSTLVVRTKDITWDGKGIVEVTVPVLRGVTIEGSSDVTVDGGQGDLALRIEGSGDLRWSGSADKLEASISGSGDMKLSGTATQASLAVAGSGDIKAGDLTSKGATISVAGSGDVEVTLDGGSLSVSIAGSGDVVWHGKAMVERASVSGSGEIVRR
jgi:Putative auto-transporter adhesin, head GIN domain